MSDLEIHTFLCRKDNIGVLMRTANGTSVAIDAPDAGAIASQLDARGWRLSHILITHHHGDHTAGNLELKDRYACEIIGPAAEASRIPGIDRQVRDGESLDVGRCRIDVIATPGHTLGHVTYVLPDAGAAFAGDTLFTMGCGRVLEGNHEMMWASLQRLAALPPQTQVYCGHEYTVANARFGLTIEPDNTVLQRRLGEAEAAVAEGRLTVPTTIELELQSNVFLRAQSPAIRARLGMGAAADWRVFGEMRERKNRS